MKLFRRPPDFVIGNPDAPYLRRWWIIPRNRFFNIYLHHILRSDDDRALHDHPWLNCSIVLKGGYFEQIPTGGKFRCPGKIVFRRSTAQHRLVLFTDTTTASEVPCWTLFITGPRIREWGFHCPKGWVHWRDFLGVPVGHAAKGDERGTGCGES